LESRISYTVNAAQEVGVPIVGDALPVCHSQELLKAGEQLILNAAACGVGRKSI